MCDVEQGLLPVEIMWLPAQMVPWFAGLNVAHRHLWDLCVWHYALGSDRSGVPYFLSKLLDFNQEMQVGKVKIIVCCSR